MRLIHSQRRIAPALLLATFALTLSACGPSEPVAIPDVTPSTSASASSSSPSSSPSSDPDAWRDQYTAGELAAYDAALQRWQSYETRSEPIWAAGKSTPAAKALFKEYWIAWQVEAARLDLYEENGITVSGLADVLWSKATSIKLTKTDSGAPQVVIQQCIDPSTITSLVNGKPPEKQRNLGTFIRTVTMEKPPSHQFMVLDVGDNTNQKQIKPCAP